MEAQTQAGLAIEQYEHRRAKQGRTRWEVTDDVKIQRDPTLPKVTFYLFPDGSGVRRDYKNKVCELTEY